MVSHTLILLHVLQVYSMLLCQFINYGVDHTARPTPQINYRAEQPSAAAGKAGMTRTPLNQDDPNPFGLAILHGELNGDSQAIPVLGSPFSDIFSDLFLGETQMTDLGSERTGGADLASDDSDVDIDDLRGVEFRRHGRRGQR
ncbi:hypothetical protein FF2_013536 [Malus domestica]